MHPGPSDGEHIESSNAPPQPRHGVGYSVLLLGAPHLSRICVVMLTCNAPSLPFLATRHLQWRGGGRGVHCGAHSA